MTESMDYVTVSRLPPPRPLHVAGIVPAVHHRGGSATGHMSVPGSRSRDISGMIRDRDAGRCSDAGVQKGARNGKSLPVDLTMAVL